VLLSLRNYQSLTTWMTSLTRVRGPCTLSASCVHMACAHQFCRKSFSRSSSQSSPTLLRRGGAFRRLLTASASSHFFVELLDQLTMLMKVCFGKFGTVRTMYLMNCCHRNLIPNTTSGNDVTTILYNNVGVIC